MTLTRFRALLIPFACCASGAPALEYDSAALMAIGTTTVKIQALAEEGKYNVGTGVVVAPERVVTNCHVTGVARVIYILRGGLRYPAVAERSDTHHDLCMLQVPGVGAPFAALADPGALRLGSPVLAAGFTGGSDLQYSDGTVRALYPHDGAKVIKTSTAFSSGASGGGLFDRQGHLVGILTFRLRGGNQHYYSMPVDWIRDWLASKDGFKPVAPLPPEQPFWQEPAAVQPRFLQAASLEAGHDWQALLALGDAWSAAQADDPQGWLQKGLAQVELRQLPLAIASLEHSVQLEPRLGEAWLCLARAYSRAGNIQELGRIRAVLADLDAGLVEELDDDKKASDPPEFGAH